MYQNQLIADQAKERIKRFHQEAETARTAPVPRKQAAQFFRRIAETLDPDLTKGGSYAPSQPRSNA